MVLEVTSSANYETTVSSEAHKLQLSKLNHWMLSEFNNKGSACSHWTFLFCSLLINFKVVNKDFSSAFPVDFNGNRIATTHCIYLKT